MDGLTWLLAGAVVGLGITLLISSRASRRQRRRAAADLNDARDMLQGGRSEIMRLRGGIDSAGDGVVLLDGDRRVIDWNAAASEMIGLPKRCGGVRPLAEVLPWGQLDNALDEVVRAAGATSTVGFELAGNGDEDGRSLVVGVRRIGDDGFAVTIHDQSRLKQLESLRRDFVANVSHELKTPLAAIKGFVETLRDDPEMPPDTRHRFVDRIQVQSERLNSLVGDLLTLSRLDETDGVPSSYQPCDLAIVVRETVGELTPLAERKQIALLAELPDGPSFVRAEREGLRQVIGNLVDNAIKYTPEQGRVEVRLTDTEDQVRLEVTDTGIGMAPDDQQRVFERFYRVDRARSRELGGTGLGLSIVKNTVRALGGEVGVQSAIGRGSTFWVTLRRLPTEA